MGKTVPAKEVLTAQAEELVYLEKKVMKLSKAKPFINHIAGMVFALQVCLLNFCVLMVSCDDPVRESVMKNDFIARVFETISGYFRFQDVLGLITTLLFVVIFVYIIPILITILAKWISFVIVSPSVYTKRDNPTEVSLYSDAQRIYERALILDEGAFAPRVLWSAVFYVISAVPFVIALLRGGFEGSYVGSEIFALVIWLLLVMLAAYLLGFPIRPVIRNLLAGNKVRFQAYCMKDEWAVKPAEPAVQKQTNKSTSQKSHSNTSTSASASSSTSTSSAINKYDSFTWTYGYVRDNEDACSDMALSCLEVSKELLSEGDARGAANGFEHVVRALELLQNFDEAHYQPPLFANAYALSRIATFALQDLNMARKYVKLSCEYAAKCARSGRPNADVARRDLTTIQGFSDALHSGASASELYEEFGCEFPYDIIGQ